MQKIYYTNSYFVISKKVVYNKSAFDFICRLCCLENIQKLASSLAYNYQNNILESMKSNSFCANSYESQHYMTKGFFLYMALLNPFPDLI